MAKKMTKPEKKGKIYKNVQYGFIPRHRKTRVAHVKPLPKESAGRELPKPTRKIPARAERTPEPLDIETIAHAEGVSPERMSYLLTLSEMIDSDEDELSKEYAKAKRTHQREKERKESDLRAFDTRTCPVCKSKNKITASPYCTICGAYVRAWDEPIETPSPRHTRLWGGKKRYNTAFDILHKK